MPDPDLMQLLGQAREDTVEQLAEVLRFQRGQVTQPLPLAETKKLSEAEVADKFEGMMLAPELAVAELARQQAEKSIVRPTQFLRDLNKARRSWERRREEG